MVSLLAGMVLLAGATTPPIVPATPRVEVPAAPRDAASSRKTPATLPPAPPPALTAHALREELRAASQRRQDELAAIARARAQLEKTAAEASAARDAAGAEKVRPQEKPKERAGTSSGTVAPSSGAPPVDRASAPELAKTIKGMKPEQAAALIGRLDQPLAAELLRRMRPADAGAVLERMKPEAAAELFSLMATRPPAAGGR